MAMDDAPVIKFMGVVAGGRGEAKGFMEIGWVREQCRNAAGFDPYPGTLNLKVDGPAFELIRRTALNRGKRIVPPPEAAGFCEARLLPVLVHGIGAALIYPMVSNYYGDTVEIIAPLLLKGHPDIKDGAAIVLSLLPPEGAPLSGAGEYASLKLITLDWEGTLVDFQWDLAGAVAETISLLEAKKVPRETLAGQNYATLYNLVTEKGAQWGFPGESLTAAVDQIYDRYDLDAASRWTPAEGLLQILAGLKCFKLALVSNVGRTGIDRMLERFGLRESFGITLTRNDVRFLKPSPEGILRAAAWAGAAKNETIHIGDSLADLFAARSAGVKCGIVLGGETAAEALLCEKPDLVLEKLSRLPIALRYGLQPNP
jgi:HAD superfamily hydrolase (TIGR01549 family)